MMVRHDAVKKIQICTTDHIKLTPGVEIWVADVILMSGLFPTFLIIMLIEQYRVM